MSEMESADMRIVRQVPFELGGDGRTIEARIIPYNVPATVIDLPEHGGSGVPYVERWLPGVFDRQVNAANRVEVWLNFEHQDGLAGIVGHGVALREEPDALYGTFRVHPGHDGDKALHMVKEGVLGGLSVEALVKRTRIAADGVAERIKGRLDKVALCRGGLAAFPGAEVLAVRHNTDSTEPFTSTTTFTSTTISTAGSSEKTTHIGETAISLEDDSEVDEMLKRIGYEPLVKRALTRKSWSGAASKYEDTDAYCAACLIDDNPAGEEKTQALCHLPVYEPNGDLNVNALPQAAARMNQTQSRSKAAAARKLLRLYGQAGMPPPPALRAMAGR